MCCMCLPKCGLMYDSLYWIAVCEIFVPNCFACIENETL